MQLGFVGTGTMGAPMAGCLIDAGHQLAVYDVRRDATAALCARGGGSRRALVRWRCRVKLCSHRCPARAKWS